jgi:hypothetical protein
MSAFFCIVLLCIDKSLVTALSPPLRSSTKISLYEVVSKSVRTGRLERELQMAEMSQRVVLSSFCESVQ